jgi:hypothetical protein
MACRGDPSGGWGDASDRTGGPMAHDGGELDRRLDASGRRLGPIARSGDASAGIAVTSGRLPTHRDGRATRQQKLRASEVRSAARQLKLPSR